MISECEGEFLPLTPAKAPGGDAGCPIWVALQPPSLFQGLSHPGMAALWLLKSMRNAENGEKGPLTASRVAWQRLFMWQNRSEQEVEVAGVGGSPPPSAEVPAGVG